MPLTYAQEARLSEAEYASVLGDIIMASRRPLANTERLRAMLDGANFIVTARDESGRLIGLARCISDGAWICYCAELAVRDSHQGQGVGKAILDQCAELLGPKIGLILVAEPEAVGFYERVGMSRHPAFLRPRQDRS